MMSVELTKIENFIRTEPPANKKGREVTYPVLRLYVRDSEGGKAIGELEGMGWVWVPATLQSYENVQQLQDEQQDTGIWRVTKQPDPNQRGNI